MTRGPLRTGVILRSTLVVDGMPTDVDDEVTDFDPPNRFGLRSVLGGTNAVTYSLREDEGGFTEVDVVLAYDLPDPPPGVQLDDDSLRSAIAGALEESLDLLASLIEMDGLS
jgi:hypothetical protein